MTVKLQLSIDPRTGRWMILNMSDQVLEVRVLGAPDLDPDKPLFVNPTGSLCTMEHGKEPSK